jgi:hypothetical protein
VCHIGYIDARANPNANELAREIADMHARSFRCATDKPIRRVQVELRAGLAGAGQRWTRFSRPLPGPRAKFAPDSPLEEAVSSEPVS